MRQIINRGRWDLNSNPLNVTGNMAVLALMQPLTLGVLTILNNTIHKISEFKLNKISVNSGEQGSVIMFNGTATIDGAFGSTSDVPN